MQFKGYLIHEKCRGCSSIGRAPALQAGGRRFDPVQLHQTQMILISIFFRELIMAVPKSKITRSRRGMRRSHDALSADAYVESKDTGELHRPHHIDLKTGMYKGKQVLKVKSKV